MGMFDNVNYKAPCWRCLKPLQDFQSKDGDCNLDTLEPEEVSRFYAYCECGAWNEYETEREFKLIKVTFSKRNSLWRTKKRPKK